MFDNSEQNTPQPACTGCSLSICNVLSTTDKLTHCPVARTINQEAKCGYNEYSGYLQLILMGLVGCSDEREWSSGVGRNKFTERAWTIHGAQLDSAQNGSFMATRSVVYPPSIFQLYVIWDMLALWTMNLTEVHQNCLSGYMKQYTTP